MVEIENLFIEFDQFQLKVEKLEVSRNEIFLIYGENGSGKTTLLNTILGFVDYNRGLVKIDGVDHKKEKWKEFTNVFIDRQYLIPYVTAKEYFQLVMKLNNYPKSKWKNSIRDHSHLLNFTDFDKKIRDLSLGNQRKVGLISTMISEPRLIIWDEPFSNLDNNSIEELNEYLKNNRENARQTIIYTGHTEERFFSNRSFSV